MKTKNGKLKVRLPVPKTGGPMKDKSKYTRKKKHKKPLHKIGREIERGIDTT